MTRRSPWVRMVLTLAVAVGTLAALLSTPSDKAPDLRTAADINQFDPGNIISDAMFFDPNALTVAQIASFIAAKGSACNVGADGSPCLKNFSQNTFTRAADGICANAYIGGTNESAATIIWKVGQACNISQKVLLVLLQKEQGFLTTTNPTARKYEIAAGMGCPDTAACDTQYYGFYNQVYSAARQYQRYATYPTKYFYRAGVTNTIQWSPDASCGTSQVYIANQATAGLYIYTPYRPNTAALRAGYGSGDGCSAYGNRNFWLYFTDWFGSTQSPGGDALLAAYAARGGASGPLGPWITWVICGQGDGGCGQVFQNGTLYWSAATGVHAVSEPILSTWGNSRERGPLGYPITELLCGYRDGGCGQVFQGGRIFTSPASGTYALSGPIESAWRAQGSETGSLAYPVSALVCGLKNGGCGQAFQGGRIYTTAATGAHVLTGPIDAAYVAQGWETGPLGYATTDMVCGLKDGGCGQAFQGGRIYTTAATGAHVLTGTFDAAYVAQGWELGGLGYATGDRACGLPGGACKQTFQGGAIYSTPAAGTTVVSGAVAAAYAAAGGDGGPLGYPLTKLLCGLRNSGCGQAFQGGRIYDTPATGAHALSGPIDAAYVAQGWETGALGYATSDAYAIPGGTAQDFQGGTIYSRSATGTAAVSGAVSSAYTAAGGDAGPLGYPLTKLLCGLKSSGCGQVFQGGRIYNTPTTGAHALSGPIDAAYVAQGWEAGPLGYATGDMVCGLPGGACKQAFQGGVMYSNPATGTFALTEAVATAYTAAGGESGPLGYPITKLLCGLRSSGCGQVFQGGRIYNTPTTGAHALSGPIDAAYVAQGWEAGPLGYATSDAYPVPGGIAQNFQGGKLTLDTATGTVTRS